MTMPWDLDFRPEDLAPGLQLTAAYDAGTRRLQCLLANHGSTTVSPARVTLRAAMGVPATSGSAWLQGQTARDDALVRVFGEPEPGGYRGTYVRRGGDTSRYLSAEMALVELPVKATPVVVVGSLRMERFTLGIELAMSAGDAQLLSMALKFGIEGVTLAPGQSVELPPVLVADGRDHESLLAIYAESVAEEMGARPAQAGLAGWRAPAHDPDLDHEPSAGFEPAFVFGDAAVAKGARRALAIAPFLLRMDARALQEEPGMALHRPDGQLLVVERGEELCAVLDCTHPAAEAHLRGVAHRLAALGYGVAELEALDLAVQPAHAVRYTEPGTTGAGHLRRGLQLLRTAAGGEALLIGASGPFGPAIGLLDGMEVAPALPGPVGAVQMARLALMRNWMHGRWWANVPPAPGTVRLPEPETRLLAAVAALSGGLPVFRGDVGAAAMPQRRRLLALVPPSGVAAAPGDHAEGPAPSAWRADLGEKRYIVGVINWTAAPRWVVTGEMLEPGEIAFAAFEGRRLGMGDVLLQPHEAAIWQVTGPGKTPRAVGDSGSLVYAGLFQRQVSGRIQVRNDSPWARTIAVEARGQVFEVDLEPGEMRWFD